MYFVKDFLLHRVREVRTCNFSRKRGRKPLELDVVVLGIRSVRHSV